MLGLPYSSGQECDLAMAEIEKETRRYILFLKGACQALSEFFC